MTVLNRCIFLASAGGTVDFVEAGAVAGYQTMESAGAINGQMYSYTAQSLDLTQWEYGIGIYVLGTTTLQRTIVKGNSLGTTAKIGFTFPPQVMLTALDIDLVPFLFLQANLGGL